MFKEIRVSPTIRVLCSENLSKNSGLRKFDQSTVTECDKQATVIGLLLITLGNVGHGRMLWKLTTITCWSFSASSFVYSVMCNWAWDTASRVSICISWDLSLLPWDCWLGCRRRIQTAKPTKDLVQLAPKVFGGLVTYHGLHEVIQNYMSIKRTVTVNVSLLLLVCIWCCISDWYLYMWLCVYIQYIVFNSS